MPYIDGKYYTDAEIAAIKRASKRNETDSDSLITSAVIGAGTGSTIIGGLLGGSFLGGLVGDVLEGDDDSWL